MLSVISLEIKHKRLASAGYKEFALKLVKALKKSVEVDLSPADEREVLDDREHR